MKRTIRYYRFYSAEGDDTAPQTLSKADADKLVQAAVAEATKKRDTEYATKLEQLSTSAKMTAAEKTKLEEEIATLRQAHMTEAEKAKAEADKLTKRASADLEAAGKRATVAESKYATYRTMTEIVAAAAKEKALSTEVIYKLLKDDVKMVEIKDDDGTVTDVAPRVNYKEGDKVLLLTPAEAVLKMKADPNYAHQFEGVSKGGAGGNNVVPGTKGKTLQEITPEEAATLSDAQYREWRAIKLVK